MAVDDWRNYRPSLIVGKSFGCASEWRPKLITETATASILVGYCRRLSHTVRVQRAGGLRLRVKT